MKKRTPSEIIKKAKAQKPDRANVTFRLPIQLMDDLTKICKKHEVTATSVLEELIQDFVANAKG